MRVVAQNIQKSVNGKSILSCANLSIDSGEICGLIGPNGAGKTTLIKCLLGLLKTDGGSISIDNMLLCSDNKSKFLLQLGAVLQYPTSISNMSIGQLFAEHFQYVGINPPATLKEFLDKVKLDVSVETQVNKLSLGMKQRLLLAVTLSHNPSFVVLDEPLNGLDVDGVETIKDILKSLKNNGIGILISSHALLELQDIATSVIFISNGATFDKRNVEEIVKNYEGGLKQYYQVLMKGGFVK